MEQKAEPSKGIKYGSLLFLAFIVFSIFYIAHQNKVTEDKIDSRFTSYDNYFFQTNSVVVDSLGSIIGEVYIQTNDKEIEEFYSDSTRRKTKYYYNLKERKLKIKEE